jgi:hypothetical protein
MIYYFHKHHRRPIVKRWGLVTCTNCHRVYDRDYNAARNIFNIAAATIFGQHAFTKKELRIPVAYVGGRPLDYSRPDYLCRAPPVVDAPAAAADLLSSTSEDEDM